MSRHTFLTSSSVFGDETETVEILSTSDVKKIVDKKNKVLMGSVDRLERDNRKLRVENQLLRKKCNEMSECLSNLSEGSCSWEKSKAEIEELKSRLDGIPDNCLKIFASVIDEVLSPKLELFARQIGVAIPPVDEAKDELHVTVQTLDSEADLKSKAKSRKKKTMSRKFTSLGGRNRK